MTHDEIDLALYDMDFTETSPGIYARGVWIVKRVDEDYEIHQLTDSGKVILMDTITPDERLDIVFRRIIDG